MSSEHSRTTNDDGRLCPVGMLRRLMSAGGSGKDRSLAVRELKLQWSLLSTSVTAGPTSTPWCACQAVCDLGYSQTWDSAGTESMDTPV
jgi:hypothetical protein